MPKKEVEERERERKGERYKIHVVTWCGQQRTKRLTSLEERRNPICDNHPMFPLLIFTHFFFLPLTENTISTGSLFF